MKLALKISMIIIILSLNIKAFAVTPNVLIIKSFSIAPYNTAIQGFEVGIGLNVDQIDLTDIKNIGLEHILAKRKPSAILAIGKTALEAVYHVDNIPILYIMVPIPNEREKTKKTNVFAIAMRQRDEFQLKIIKDLIPTTEVIALFFNPNNLDEHKLKSVSNQIGVRLNSCQVQSSMDVLANLNDLWRQEKSDALWVYPDSSIMDPNCAEILLLASLEHRVPVIAFSKVFLALGAVLSIAIDEYDIGLQAAKLMKKILSNEIFKPDKIFYACKAVVTINKTAAAKQKLLIKTDKNELILEDVNTDTEN